MPKTVPIKEERDYIQLTNKLEPLIAQRDKLKQKLVKYHSKGWLFTLIKPTDTSAGVFTPPWKLLCFELIKRFMKKKERKEWLDNLPKRFPRRERAPSFLILGKKAKEK